MFSGLGASHEIDAWLAAGQITHNGELAVAGARLRVGDEVGIREHCYRIHAADAPGRLIVSAHSPVAPQITGQVRAQCGLHKCLTMYFRNVLRTVCRRSFNSGISFRHFFHRDDAFYRECERYRITSLSGHALDLDRFSDIRVTRFIRDPRDLLVSGYHYHKRGAEHWCRVADPCAAEWTVVGGAVPGAIKPGSSFRDYLNGVSVEEGLLAELEFRRNHFDSMLRWPDDERVRSYRYEDILGREGEVFADIFRFMGMSPLHTRMARFYGRRLSASRGSKGSGHIRNPRSGQWREYFTPVVQRRFDELYGEVLARYGYA